MITLEAFDVIGVIGFWKALRLSGYRSATPKTW